MSRAGLASLELQFQSVAELFSSRFVPVLNCSIKWSTSGFYKVGLTSLPCEERRSLSRTFPVLALASTRWKTGFCGSFHSALLCFGRGDRAAHFTALPSASVILLFCIWH